MIPIQHRESDATPPLLAHFLIVASALAGCTAAPPLAEDRRTGGEPLFAPEARLVAPVADAEALIHVFATDLDGDGDPDVIAQQQSRDGGLMWYENQGGGTFGSQQLMITEDQRTEPFYATDFPFHATDLDGDGTSDLLTFGNFGKKITWRQNQGRGRIGARRVITEVEGLHPVSVYATDLDGDGDADVLSASWDVYPGHKGLIAWYENLGNGTFSSQQVITTDVPGAASVYATDLDGDGDADVLSAHWRGSRQGVLAPQAGHIAWYENQGGGAFGSQQVITTDASGAFWWVYAIDLNGDGDADVLTHCANEDRFVWYENLGGGAFGNLQVIAPDAPGAIAAYATDLDNDGDVDVLSASVDDKTKIAWYENQGAGVFGSQQVITTVEVQAGLIHAMDMDDDGDTDVLTATVDGKVVWHENRTNKPGAGQALYPRVQPPVSHYLWRRWMPDFQDKKRR